MFSYTVEIVNFDDEKQELDISSSFDIYERANYEANTHYAKYANEQEALTTILEGLINKQHMGVKILKIVSVR